jgi:hypothetical protein
MAIRGYPSIVINVLKKNHKKPKVLDFLVFSLFSAGPCRPFFETRRDFPAECAKFEPESYNGVGRPLTNTSYHSFAFPHTFSAGPQNIVIHFTIFWIINSDATLQTTSTTHRSNGMVRHCAGAVHELGPCR